MTDALILSNALDTNGQNARYVKAARRHGSSDVVIEALAIGNVDPGGVVGRLQEAAGKHPEVGLRIRSAHKHDQYFRFSGDLRWGPDAPREERQEVRRLAKAADVIHLNNSDRGLFELGMSKDKKPTVLHHHGSLFRNNTEHMLIKARAHKMIQAVSTVDLQRPAPDLLHWLPTAYDVAELAAFRKRHRRADDGRVRVGHFPTNRDLKRTDLLVKAIAELQAEGLPVDLYPPQLAEKDWLPRWDWDTAMAAKASCDIVFDQLMFGYGCNAVEAWAMGLPVISGADDWTTKRMSDLWGYVPYQHVTERSLKTTLRKMVLSADMRADVAAQGKAHVLAHHDELPALERLAELYGMALGSKYRPRIEGKGVSFASTRRRVMVFAGEEVDFSKGVATVTDVEVQEAIRRRVKTRPLFGISEVEDVA